MSDLINICLVKPAGLAGEAMLKALEATDLPLGDLFLLDSPDSGSEFESKVGTRLEFKDQYLSVKSIADFDFSQSQYAIFLEDPELPKTYAAEAIANDCYAVDCTGAFGDDEDVPLVLPALNKEDLNPYLMTPSLIALPGSHTAMLWSLLAPIHRAVGVDRVNLMLLQSVSSFGKSGVEALAGQTARLLNAQPLENLSPFDKQVAFNVLPNQSELDWQGYSQAELIIAQESAQLLGLDSLAVNTTCVTVPAFYGSGMAIHIETTGHLTLDDACQLLAGNRAIASGEDAVTLFSGSPTPVDIDNEDPKIKVGRLRADISHSNGLDLWAVADSMRIGVAEPVIELLSLLESQ